MDLRGHGDSYRPTHGYAVPSFLDDVQAVVEDFELEGAGYLGYSMGSRLGWRFAATHPDVFSALVLGGLPGDDPFAGFRPQFAREAHATGNHDDLGSAESFVVSLATGLPENDPAALIELAAEVAKTRFNPHEATPVVPTLLMTGDNDDRAPDSAELAALVPHGEFRSIPGRNHINAITSRHFKAGAVQWFGEYLS